MEATYESAHSSQDVLVALETRVRIILDRGSMDWGEIRGVTGDLGLLLAAKFGWAARRGPFRGIVVEGFSHPAPFLLGSYESELEQAIESLIAVSPPRVVNVGSGEGWYAAGLAARLPEAHVIAYDNVPARIEDTRLTLRNNRLEHRVEVRLGADVRQFGNDLVPGTLVVMDCEGWEYALLDPALAPGLRDCFVLVEVHDCALEGLSDILLERFRPTHAIERIPSGIRDTRGFPELEGLPDLAATLAIWEFRVEMEWFVLRPLGHHFH